MAILAVLSTPNTADAPDSAPRRIVSELHTIEIEVVQFERKGTNALLYLWIYGVPPVKSESILANDPKLSNIQQFGRTDNGAFYKVKWQVDSPGLHCVTTMNGIVMQARGTAKEWQLKIWFEDGSDASAFQQCCESQGIPLQVDQLASIADLLAEERVNITQAQREVLILAYQEGYFDDPRHVSQKDLGGELGISSSAVGRRLRRGIRGLVEESLIN